MKGYIIFILLVYILADALGYNPFVAAFTVIAVPVGVLALLVIAILIWAYFDIKKQMAEIERNKKEKEEPKKFEVPFP